VADKPAYPRAEHPVGAPSVTGKKALYVNRGFNRNIIGIPRDESDAMLPYLYQHAENPLFQCRFRWTENASRSGTTAAPSTRDVDYWPHTVPYACDGEGRTAGVRACRLGGKAKRATISLQTHREWWHAALCHPTNSRPRAGSARQLDARDASLARDGSR